MWQIIIGWFHPDIGHWIFWGSLLVTFVASVMGKDQQQRLEQGKFGLAAGTSLGGLSAILKEQKDLLVVGFVGSAVGGLLGWLYYLALASLLVRFPKLEKLLAFQVGGLEGLQNKLDVESKQNLRTGFDTWSEKLSRMIADMKDVLLQHPEDPNWESEAIMVIHSWLSCSVDALALVFGTLANLPKHQSRVTIIVYGPGATAGQPTGRHWISYPGQLTPHSKDMVFNDDSIGYKVLTEKSPSPFFTTKESATKLGQPREEDASYRPFITFRLTDKAVMALDWPEELAECDDYVQSARRLFYAHITPAISEVLSHWPRDLDVAAGVALSAPPARPPTPPLVQQPGSRSAAAADPAKGGSTA